MKIYTCVWCGQHPHSPCDVSFYYQRLKAHKCTQTCTILDSFRKRNNTYPVPRTTVRFFHQSIYMKINVQSAPHANSSAGVSLRIWHIPDDKKIWNRECLINFYRSVFLIRHIHAMKARVSIDVFYRYSAWQEEGKPRLLIFQLIE
jgi:hypothetical protein